MSIRLKLWVNAIIALVCVFGVGMTGSFFTNRVEKVSSALLETQALPLLTIHEAEITAKDIFSQLVIHNGASGVDAMQQIEHTIAALQDTLTGQLQEYEDHAQDVSSIASAEWVQEFQQKWEQFSLLSQQIMLLSRNFEKEEALMGIVGTGQETFNQALSVLKKAAEIHWQQMTLLRDEAAKDRRNAGIIIGIVTLAGGLMGLISAWRVIQTISRPLNTSVHAANRLAEGDLTQHINAVSNDETGQLLAAMKNMLEKFTGIVVDVRNAAKSVVSSSQAMNSSAAQMSQGAARQASSTEEVSASMEQMVANIRQNAENAVQTEKIAVKAANDAQESRQAVTEAVKAMQDIAQKIMIVEDITRQTRMLSLNATIEAARAQEHGKGFAVVAAEVRALAERSQTAATEINQLASSSVAIAENAGTMLTKLVPDIQKTAELVQEISAASNEQTTGAGQINRAIQQLDNVTQQNSAASEELSATAEELTGQANMLFQTMAFFKTEQDPQDSEDTMLAAA